MFLWLEIIDLVQYRQNDPENEADGADNEREDVANIGQVSDLLKCQSDTNGAFTNQPEDLVEKVKTYDF